MQASPTTIVVATLASYIAGSLWYLVLGRSWRAAVGWSEGGPAYRPTAVELGIALVGQLAMAIALSSLIGALSLKSLATDFGLAACVWLGFILPTLTTNVVFQRRNPTLIWQDGLHWLLILGVQAFVFGQL